MTTNDRTTNDRTTMRWGGQQGDGARGGASGRSGPGPQSGGPRPGPAARSGRSGPTGPGGTGGPGGPVGPGGPTGGPVNLRGNDERADWQERLALRNWSLPVKLAAVLLVPTVFVVSLGVLRIIEQTEKASSYDGVQQAVSLEDRTSRLLADLAAERTASAVYVASRRAGGPAVVRQRADASENTADDWRQAANRADSLDEQARSSYGDAANGLQQLYRLRTEVQTGRVDAAGVLARYSEEINALLAFDRSLTREAADPSVAGLAGGLYSLSVVREEDAYVQAVVAAGIAAGRIDAPSIDEARNATLRRTIAVDDFRAAVGTDNAPLADAVVGPDVDARDRLAQVVLGRGSAGLPLQVAGPEWQRVSDAVTDRVADTSEQLRGRLQANAQALQDGARNAAGIASVVLLLALIAGAAVVFFVTRSLLRPLRLLRRTALDVAERRLPGAVRSLREGEAPDTDVAPTPIRTREEIGQVARAFDQVHEQAVRLAAEQAGLRSAFNSIFINLSRRSQALVERQLRLIEQLENNEEDPEALSNLFQLDHLATRMRRNSENLLVLSGTDLSRRGTRPVPVVDVLRAAASEVEQYQRVDLQSAPNVMLLGRTASDVVHLVAELLENATSFSAPDTRVDVVVTQAADGGLGIDIADAGVGMTPVDMRDANTRLASPPTVDVSASRRMGLFVVGRLAIRHGIAVVLRDRDPAGIVASVTVPANAILAAVPAGGQRPPEQVGGGRRGGAAALGAGAAGAAMLAGAAGASGSSGSAGPGSDAPSGTGTIQRQERANGRPALPSRTGGDRAAAGGPASGDSGGPATSFFDPGASRTGGAGSPGGDGPADAGTATGNGSSTTGNGPSGGADGDLPRRGPRGVLGNLPTRNGRRFPPPGPDAGGTSSGSDATGTNGHGAPATNGSSANGTGTNGTGTNGTGAKATNGHAPTNGHPRPGAEGGLPRRGPRPLGPVEEVPPPTDADAPATPEQPDDDGDDADDRVATTTPESSDASGVTVWRADGGGQEQSGRDEPAAAEDGEDDGGEQAGRHGWRRQPPAEGPPVPSSGSPQHRLGPPSSPTPATPAGRPGPSPQPPYPPPPGWAPGRPPAGAPTTPERRGPVPAGAETPASDRPVAGAAPTRGAPTSDAPASGSTGAGGVAAAGAAAGAAALGVAGAAAWHRAQRPGTGSTETPATTTPATPATTEAAPGAAGAPVEARVGGAPTPTDAPPDDTDQARSRRARALPMTVRRGSVPLRPRETQPGQGGPADAERTASPASPTSPTAPERTAPDTADASATAAPAAPAPTAASTASSASSATASPATPDAEAEPGTEGGPRPLGRRRGPTGGLVPPPSSTPRLRPRRPETAGEQAPDGAGAGENGDEGLFAPGDDEQPNGTHAPELPRRPAGVPNGAPRPAAGSAPGAPPRAVPERLPLRAGTAGRERTPIFDEVASVWFREGTPGEAQSEDWQTTGDAGWRAAAASTEATDGGTTEAGLPRRRPRARLVPGAADSAAGARATAPGAATPKSREAPAATNGANGASAGDAQPKVGANGVNGSHGGDAAGGGPRRNPDAVRGRLASYQRGVNEGRSSRRGPNANGDGDRPGDEEEQ